MEFKVYLANIGTRARRVLGLGLPNDEPPSFTVQIDDKDFKEASLETLFEKIVSMGNGSFTKDDLTARTVFKGDDKLELGPQDFTYKRVGPLNVLVMDGIYIDGPLFMNLSNNVERVGVNPIITMEVGRRQAPPAQERTFANEDWGDFNDPDLEAPVDESTLVSRTFPTNVGSVLPPPESYHAPVSTDAINQGRFDARKDKSPEQIIETMLERVGLKKLKDEQIKQIQRLAESPLLKAEHPIGALSGFMSEWDGHKSFKTFRRDFNTHIFKKAVERELKNPLNDSIKRRLKTLLPYFDDPNHFRREIRQLKHIIRHSNPRDAKAFAKAAEAITNSRYEKAFDEALKENSIKFKPTDIEKLVKLANPVQRPKQANAVLFEVIGQCTGLKGQSFEKVLAIAKRAKKIHNGKQPLNPITKTTSSLYAKNSDRRKSQEPTPVGPPRYMRPPFRPEK